jgi:hypothetical protein
MTQMRSAITFRSLMIRALLAGLLAGWSGVVCAQHRAAYLFLQSPSYSMVAGNRMAGYRGQQQAAPIERRPPGVGEQHLVNPDGQRGGEHLADWMSRHSGMTLEQQQQALDREPGFRQLPPPQQLRMHEHLAELHSMSPGERGRLLEHTEAMERLTPFQRSEVRGALQQLGSLPLEQRDMVARCFRQLRTLPPSQRMGAMMSGRFSGLNPAQRTVLMNLIQIAPMLPPQ